MESLCGVQHYPASFSCKVYCMVLSLNWWAGKKLPSWIFSWKKVWAWRLESPSETPNKRIDPSWIRSEWGTTVSQRFDTLVLNPFFCLQILFSQRESFFCHNGKGFVVDGVKKYSVGHCLDSRTQGKWQRGLREQSAGVFLSSEKRRRGDKRPIHYNKVSQFQRGRNCTFLSVVQPLVQSSSSEIFSLEEKSFSLLQNNSTFLIWNILTDFDSLTMTSLHYSSSGFLRCFPNK